MTFATNLGITFGVLPDLLSIHYEISICKQHLNVLATLKIHLYVACHSFYVFLDCLIEIQDFAGFWAYLGGSKLGVWQPAVHTL